MPRYVRNFWCSADVSGYSAEKEFGPRPANGRVDITMYMRRPGENLMSQWDMRLVGYVQDESRTPKVDLFLNNRNRNWTYRLCEVTLQPHDEEPLVEVKICNTPSLWHKLMGPPDSDSSLVVVTNEIINTSKFRKE